MLVSLGKRKLIIHIGMPKTGSTSIQTMLYRLSPSSEQLGVHLVAAMSWRGKHSRLITAPEPERQLRFGSTEDKSQALFREVSRCRAERMVISAEDLSHARGTRQSVKRFADLAETANLDIEVIACVRPQWQWLESLWTERVRKLAILAPFDDWVETNLGEQRLDYAHVLSPWKDAFGRVTVVSLEHSRLPDGLLVRFLDILDVDDAQVVAAATQMPHKNRRRPAKWLEVRRLVGCTLHRHGLSGWERLHAVQRLVSLSAARDDDAPFAGLSPEQIGSITDRFGSRNALLGRGYGLESESVLFRDQPVYQFSGQPGDLGRLERRRAAEGHGSRASQTRPGTARSRVSGQNMMSRSCLSGFATTLSRSEAAAKTS